MFFSSRPTPSPDRAISCPSGGPEEEQTDGQQVRSGVGQPIREACPEHSRRAQGKPTIYRPSAPHLIRVCPDCAGPIVRASGCISCAQCGWGRCG